MSLFPRRSRSGPSTITAAAAPIRPSDDKLIASLSTVQRPWQTSAWNFYKSMAEIHYPASYKGNALSRFRLYIGEIPQDSPTAEPREMEGDKRSDLYRAAEDILASLDSMFGGHAELLRLYGINISVAADCWLVGVDLAGDTEWEILSISELKAQNDGTWQRYPAGGSTPLDEWKPQYANRMWRKHPEFSALADGPMQSLVGDCERLAVLNRSLTNRLLSKLAQAGYFFVPSSMTISGAPEAPTGDGALGTDPMMVALLGQAQRSVLEGSGSFIPTGIRGPAAEGEAIRFINMDRTIDRVEMELRSELRDNIARGIDLPPEVQQGMGSGTHWSTWAVSDSSYQDHILPDARDFAASLTRCLLWPLLDDWNKANGSKSSKADVRRLIVDGDGSAVVTRPNAAEDMRQLHDRIVISDAALRKGAGADDDDAPSEEEFVRQLGRKINHPYLATYGLDIQDDVDWDIVAKVSSGPGAPGAGGTPESRRPVDNGTPGRSEREVEKGKASEDPQVWAAVAEGHLAAALKKVGAQVRGRCEPHPEVMAELKRLPNEKVAAAALDHLDALGLTEGDILDWTREALGDLASALVTLGAEDQRVHFFVSALAARSLATTPRPLSVLAAEVISHPGL